MRPETLYLLASAGNLFLANLVAFRARRARGALPIALLCLSLFIWAISEAAKPEKPGSYWHYIRLVGSSMAPAFLWHFVLVFAHRERALRKWMAGLYAVTALFTLTTAGALVSDPLRGWVDHKAWNLTYLAVLFPFLVASLLLVRRRSAEVEREVERNACNFVALGIAMGTFTGLTDLTHILWEAIPPLGHVGSLMCTVVLAIAILRHRLLEQQAPVRNALFALLGVLSAAIVLTVLYRPLPGAWDATLVAGVVGLVAALALYRLLFVRLYEQADRRKRLALIGTMAAGVAHEIKNPLAAIKGAAQFVQKDLEGAEGKGEAREYLKLLVDEVDRLNGVVESFLTYARPLEPRRQDVPLPPLLADILRFQAPSVPPAVRVETSFDPDLPPAWADPVLLTHAVTNVFRNSVEALSGKGVITVRTRPRVTALRSYAAIEIEDDGPGIPRDDLERIFQPFYTTKAKGTGLGLAIASRLMESHGGDIDVENILPRGCRFTLLIPLRTL